MRTAGGGLTQRVLPALAAACLLGGPTALAFFAGGYFAEPRLIAAIVAWSIVLALSVAGPAPLPAGTPGRLALAGLVLLTVWTAASVTWAPVRGAALESVERLMLYTGAFLAAIGTFRTARMLRAAEPALAAGATVVIAYGLAERVLPGLVDLSESRGADGRLEQPLTYWNAEGALAAFGLVLCARLAGDPSRRPAIRAAAAAAIAPLGAGVYLSYSRGAIAAAVLGLIVLVAAAPTAQQLRAALVALGTAIAAAVAAAAFSGPASLAGALGDREREGAAVLVLLLLVAGCAALLALRGAAAPDRPLPSPRRLTHVAVAAFVAVLAGLVIGGLAERPSRAELGAGAAAGRLATASSNRYEYWRVGLDAFVREPLTGVGAGGYRVEWLRERDFAETVKDAHSLEVELAAELGVVGVGAFLLLIAGAGLAARRALARHRAAAAGSCAATLVWLVHASIDWDWQLPAVTLPAIVLAGALVVLSEAPPAGAGRARPAPAAVSVAR